MLPSSLQRTRRKRNRSTRKLKGGTVNLFTSPPFISGAVFKDMCRYNLDDRYTVVPFDKAVKEGDKVFLKVIDIDTFIKQPPPVKVTVVISNSDETFDDTLYKKVSPYSKMIYAINCSAKGAIQIPIGFRDDAYAPHKEYVDILNDPNISGKKEILCFLSFSIPTNPTERQATHDVFAKHPWATIDNEYMNTPLSLSLNHNNPQTIKKRKDCYTKLKRAKCVICPAGAGRDTHRVYETLFFGAIPVIKTSFLDPMYEKLGGCWIVKDWSEVTEESCNQHWSSMAKGMSVDPRNIVKGGANTTQPHHTKRTEQGQTEIHGIPLTIYQSWTTNSIPPKMKENMDRVLRENPQFDHYLFSHQSCENFIKNNFSKSVLKAFRMLKPGAYKSDLWRYCILWKNGGVYMDVKFYPVVPLVDLLTNHPDLFIRDDIATHTSNVTMQCKKSAGLYNGFLVSKPNNPIFKEMIDTIVKHCKAKNLENSMLQVTGPCLLGQVVTRHKSGKFIDELTFQFVGGNEEGEQMGFIQQDGNNVIKQYKEYRSEQSNAKTGHYSNAWKDNNIYQNTENSWNNT
jgi:hypothetical protein